MKQEIELNQEQTPEQPWLEKFLKRRNIDPMDTEIIKELALFPRESIVEHMHNYFQSEKEKSVQMLTNQIENSKSRILDISNSETRKELEQQIKIFTLFRDFCSKYGWDISWGLVSALEEKNKI